MGGYGDPLDRDPELVASDVKNKYITHQQAFDDYGVKISTEDYLVTGLTNKRDD